MRRLILKYLTSFMTKFSDISPLFDVQEIPDRHIPEEIKIYKENLEEKQ